MVTKENVNDIKHKNNNIPLDSVTNRNNKNLQNVNFENLDDEVKSKMFSKIENLKSTWNEFLQFEKYHKIVFSNKVQKTDSKPIKRKSKFSGYNDNLIEFNKTSESLNPFSLNINPNPSNNISPDTPHSPNIVFLNTKSDQHTSSTNPNLDTKTITLP